MGKLITETPYSEITATLEVLDRCGATRDDLAKFRKASSYVHQEVVRLIKYGEAHVVNSSAGIAMDRTRPFNPSKFIGEGWTIWKGSAGGNGLKGEEEQDKRSLILSHVELANVRFETCLDPHEQYITGEERLSRLKKADRTRLDAKIFETLWLNQDLIPESWKEKTNDNTTCIFFDGTILRDPDGYRYAPYLCWGVGEWYRLVDWLGSNRGACDPSAVLAST